MIEHKHLIVRATVKDPPIEEDISWLRDWFAVLIDDLGMTLLSGPHIKYVDVKGNSGVTGVCIIETSHIAMHVWDEQSPALMQLDVYTCGALDPQVVIDALKAFKPVKTEFKFLDREYGLKEIYSGMLGGKQPGST
jgi:S-adenosylmethionine/arginine decarboxylase-like enzyme